MEEAKATLIKQLEKLSKITGSEVEVARAMCEIANALIGIERAKIALGKGEFGAKIKKGK